MNVVRGRAEDFTSKLSIMLGRKQRAGRKNQPSYEVGDSYCVIGGNIGAKWGTFEGEATVGAVPLVLPGGTVLAFAGTDDSEVGFIGGGQVGCQWQTGAVVVGIEGDFVATDIERTFIVGGLAVNPFNAGDTFTFQNDWQASLRGRLGWAFDRSMIYVTGGVAWANVETTAALVAQPPFFPAVTFATDQTLTGWTLGGGYEFAFTPNLSLGVEYRFTSYDRDNFGFGNLLVAAPATFAAFAANADLETHEVTARLNWRFDLFGKGPVPRY